MRLLSGWLALAIVCGLAVAGCKKDGGKTGGTTDKSATTTGAATDKITKENADKVKVDMSEDEVKAILGPPSEAPKELSLPPVTGKSYRWVSGDKSIVVNFKDGKVVPPGAVKHGF